MPTLWNLNQIVPNIRKPRAHTGGWFCATDHGRHSRLSSFYWFLIRMSLVTSNPCDRLERPRATQTDNLGVWYVILGISRNIGMSLFSCEPKAASSAGLS